MDKEIARLLVPLVPKSNDDLFEIYVNSRVNYLHRQLETLSEVNEIMKVQGQIKEVRRLLTLREEIQKER